MRRIHAILFLLVICVFLLVALNTKGPSDVFSGSTEKISLTHVLPLLVFCKNRTDVFSRTLDSLVHVKNVRVDMIIAIQDVLCQKIYV